MSHRDTPELRDGQELTAQSARETTRTLDLDDLRRLMKKVTTVADVCDHDLRGAPITHYDVLWTGAYRDCLIRLINAVRQEALELELSQERERGRGLERKDCAWVEDSDGIWNTGCGQVWVFTDGGPEDNDCTYCYSCGGKLAADHYSADDESDPDAALPSAPGKAEE